MAVLWRDRREDDYWQQDELFSCPYWRCCPDPLLLPSSSPEWSPLSVRIPTESESDVSVSIASDGDSLLCLILSKAEEKSRPEEDFVLHAAEHMSSGKRKSVVAFDSSDSSGDEEVAAAPTRRKASGVRRQKMKRRCIKYQLDWEEKPYWKGGFPSPRSLARGTAKCVARTWSLKVEALTIWSDTANQ